MPRPVDSLAPAAGCAPVTALAQTPQQHVPDLMVVTESCCLSNLGAAVAYGQHSHALQMFLFVQI